MLVKKNCWVLEDGRIGEVERCIEDFSQNFRLEMLDYIQICGLNGSPQFDTICPDWSYYGLVNLSLLLVMSADLGPCNLQRTPKRLLSSCLFFVTCYFPGKLFVKMGT